MPALISITKVRLENLPAAAQGTLGVVRVKFRAGTAAAETIPRRVNPDGSVEWLETLVMIVHDTTKQLVAVVSQENSSGGWSFVPGGRFEGAVVTELPRDWHGASSVPTDPTFHAQLSVEMEDGVQRDTRLPPQAGMDKSGGGFRAPPPTYGGGPFAPGARGGRGGRGTSRMDRAVSGDSSGVTFGAAYGMGTPSGSFGSGSFGYVDAMGSPEVYVDARSGEGAGAGGGGGGAPAGGGSIDLSTSSGASSLGGGFVTAVAVPAAVPAEADAIFPSEAPVMRRASTYSASSSSSYSVPPARGAPARRTSKKKYPGGWVQSGSQDGSFRSSIRMSMSDMGSFSDGSVATTAAAAAEAEEPAPPAPADTHLPSPVGTYVPSRLLDDRFELKEDEEGKAERPPQAEQGFQLEDEYSLGGPAFKRTSLTDARPGLGAFGSAEHEKRDTEERLREEAKNERRPSDDEYRRDTEERAEEVKTERRSSDDEYRSFVLAAGDLPSDTEKKSWFHLRRKASKGRSRASSAGAASSDSAAGSSETRSYPDRDGRSMSMSVSSGTSAAEEKEELEPGRAAALPPAPRQASAKWKKAGRTTGSLRKTLSRLSRKRPSPLEQERLRGFGAASGAAAPPPPSAPPAAGAPPTKLVGPSELSGRRTAPAPLASRQPSTAPPSYQEVLRQRGLLPRTLVASVSAGGVAASRHPELAMSRSRSSSLEPMAAAEAAESPVDARVLPQVPTFPTAASFSPSAPAAEEPSSVWVRAGGFGESGAPSAQHSSVDDEAAAAVAAVAVAEASQQQQQQQQQEEEGPSTRADWKDDYVVGTSLQGAAPGAPGRAPPPLPARSLAARPFPPRPLPAASSETGDDSSDSELVRRLGGLSRGEDDAYSSADNVYDTGVALGGLSLPPSAPGREEEIAVPEPPVYSAMPAESLDGSGRVDAPVDSDSLTLYPAVRPRQQLEPTESRTTTSSEVTNVEPGFSATQPRQMVPRQLPPESTSVSSESTSISGNMSLQGSNTRAVPPERDPVIFSCVAPPVVKPGTDFDLQIAAFLTRHRRAFLREVLSKGAVEGGRPEGMSIAKGKRVTVELLLPEDKFKVFSLERTASRPTVRDFVWAGEPTGAEFRVRCKAGVDPGLVKCEAMVIEGSRVKRLSFVIEVSGADFVPRALDSGPNGEVEIDTRMKEEEGNMAEVPFDELKFVRELGEGVQGFTTHCRWNDKDVAVKSLTSFPDFYPSSGPTRNGLKHEATILSLLGHHPNVVELYGWSRQGGSSGDEGIHIVTKLEEGGSIADALGLKKRGNGSNGGGRFALNGGRNGNGNGRGHGNGYGSEFDGQVRVAWARDIARGLANSHAAGVLHNDVASRNALLSSRNPESRALLCDFGLSRFLRDGLQKAHCIDKMDHEKWPILQMPCESLFHPYPLTTESDTWMYGMFLHELFAGESPWAGVDKNEAKRLVMEGKRPPKVPQMLMDRGTHLVKLYNACLDKDSEKRPTLEHVVNELSTNLTSMSLSWGNGASPSRLAGEFEPLR